MWTNQQTRDTYVSLFSGDLRHVLDEINDMFCFGCADEGDSPDDYADVGDTLRELLQAPDVDYNQLGYEIAMRFTHG